MNDFEQEELVKQVEGLHQQVEYLLACCESCDNCKPVKKSKKEK